MDAKLQHHTFSATSDGNPDPKQFPKYVVHEGDNPRGAISRETLLGNATSTFEDLRRLAFDTRVMSAGNRLPGLLTSLKEKLDPNSGAQLREVYYELARWDRRSADDSVAMTLFSLWHDGVSRDPATAATPERQLAVLADVVATLERDFGTWKVGWGELSRPQRLIVIGLQALARLWSTISLARLKEFQLISEGIGKPDFLDRAMVGHLRYGKPHSRQPGRKNINIRYAYIRRWHRKRSRLKRQRSLLMPICEVHRNHVTNSKACWIFFHYLKTQLPNIEILCQSEIADEYFDTHSQDLRSWQIRWNNRGFTLTDNSFDRQCLTIFGFKDAEIRLSTFGEHRLDPPQDCVAAIRKAHANTHLQ